MKILVIADVESKSLWDYFSPDKLEGVELIISCGDLSSRYLEFLVTLGNCTLLYIRGNHDTGYDKKPPDGCICIENMIYNHRGMRIAGLGGSMKYKESPDMYTEREMAARVRKLSRKARFTGGIDLLVTHAPPAGYGDLEDLPHRGFACFNELLMKVRPLYLLHGHVHKNYSRGFERRREHPSGAVIINAYESCILEIPEEAFPETGKTGSFLYDRYCRTMERFRGFGHNPV